jgi:hypothetical protein
MVDSFEKEEGGGRQTSAELRHGSMVFASIHSNRRYAMVAGMA